MKKYIVRVQYTKSNSRCLKEHDLVWLVKAKNDLDLENIMSREYCELLDYIDGYAYEQISNSMFKKNDTKLMCGNWVGVEVIKDDLKRAKLIDEMTEAEE